MHHTRRAFLRGAGAAVALPLLPSLPAARGAGTTPAAKPPVRTACMYFPNGVWEKAWVPEKVGADYELPFSLTPLEPVKGDVLVLTGLDKKHSHGGDGHYAKTANFLTGLRVTKTTGKDINVGGASIDQMIANRVGGATPLPSLELGIDPVISGIDSNVGYTRLYGSHVSWRSATVPVAKEINPRLVYERMFGAKDAKGKPMAARDAGDDRSLLDLTLEDARGLRGKLGRDDQFKLDEYLDAVRAVERRVEYAERNPNGGGRPVDPGAPPAGAPPAGVPREFRDHVKLMLDLIVLAFWSDSTRVVSFMFANDVSGRNFTFLDGVHSGHHETSHHANQAEKVEQYKRIVRWHAGQFAYLCGKLKAVREGDGTLLDHSMILMGSGMSDGNRHDPSNLPILLGGRGGNTINSGRHVASPKGTPLCELYLAMLQRAGVPTKEFGDAGSAMAIGV